MIHVHVDLEGMGQRLLLVNIIYYISGSINGNLTKFSTQVYLRACSFGIFWNKNIFQNIFRVFCSWEQNSRNGNPGIAE